MDYIILARQGCRLTALLDGTVSPRTRGEEYFLRCIRDDADYDSHQSLEADAWRQFVERRKYDGDLAGHAERARPFADKNVGCDSSRQLDRRLKGLHGS